MMKKVFQFIFLLSLFVFSNAVFSQMQTKSAPRIYTKAEQDLIERMKHADKDEVVAYIREVLDMTVPASHQIPKHYADFETYSDASEALAKDRFPNFFNKTGDDLIQEIKSFPVEYKSMVMDYRRLRELYQHTIEK
jgi:hypothetical protein